jgi:hypothetical protein
MPRMAQRMLSTTIDLGSSVRFHTVLLPRAAYEAAYVAPCGLIGFAFESQSGFHSFGSDRRTPYRTRPNSLAFIPAGCDVYSQSDCGGEYLLIRAGDWNPPAARRFNDVMLPHAHMSTVFKRTLNVAPSALQRARAEPPEFSSYRQGVATDS